MEKKNKPIRLLAALLPIIAGLALATWRPANGSVPARAAIGNHYATPSPADTTRFPVKKTQAKDYRYLDGNYPLDLKTPDNIRTEFIYDEKTNTYLLVTKLGDKPLGSPIPFTPKEYLRYMQRDSTRRYFMEKERLEAQQEGKKRFNPLEMTFDLGPAEKLFGPGGVKLRTQGSAEVAMGAKSNATNNPSLPENARKHSYFDFSEKIQTNVQASVGTKLNFGMNYNTESTFDFDAKKLKLAFEGEEDDIIKLIEAGNVSMNTRNTLIRGGASLFGIHTKMQFGKLDVDMVVSQQEAETKRVSTKGGAQTTPFELSAGQYDENRHFFFGHYFRDRYDGAMKTLPFISSGVKINRVEVWVTNKKGNFDNTQTRNIVAFTDLGEPEKIALPSVSPSMSTNSLPANQANSLYPMLLSMPNLRFIDQVTQELGGIMQGGRDYEKVESARLLNPADYTVNSILGYISLNMRLSADEVLGIAFEYTYNGQVYQVGEFSTDRPDNSTENLYVKLLKGTAMSSTSPYWHFMMKNAYQLGGGVYNVQKEKFKLNVFYQSDSAGVYQPYISEGKIKGQLLLRVLGMDRLDAKQEPYPDGTYDFVDGYTILPQKGVVILPTVEPFGKTLADAFGDPVLAKKYCFQELYDTTAVAAQQVAEKNKFIFRGEYKASSGGDISLGAINVTPGSVVVTAGGVKLTENVDYTVDYLSGNVSIINEAILASGTPINVSLENRGLMNMQRKTMFGIDLNYNFSKDFTLGGTFMHLSEMPLTTKSVIGDESLKNTLWGLNLNYRTQAQWLTNALDLLPFVELTKPSEITINAEFAHLIPGHYQSKYAQGNSYLDDFESSQSYIDLMNPYSWMLSSTPFQDGAGPVFFPEASLTNDIDYGKHRAKLSWFYIDPIFTRENSAGMPAHLKNDLEQLSNHYVREVKTSELFPYRDQTYNMNSYLHTLLMSYYPSERGPYNLNTVDMQSDGRLANPQSNWGGIMRKIDQSDFEASNIEYVEFWLLDPFIYNKETAKGGSMYINLGEISEEVLKDEKKFFENGMPINDDPAAIETTVWGKVPKRQGTGYAFDNTAGARPKQDVGFNGLTTEEEKEFPAYAEYISRLTSIVSPDVLGQWSADPFSPINDPGGDNFHHYRGADYDDARKSILDRYKQYNGVEGNSAEATNDITGYNVSSRLVPDVEDINQDNTLNEIEKYFQYRVELHPSKMVVGQNYIVDSRTKEVELRNGKKETITWYQFKVPVREFERKIGGITDFKTIRFMRVYLTNFSEEVILRFGTFKLVRGDWRQYERELHPANLTPISNAKLEVSTVNIEENGDRKPVNYVLPPGVLRSLDPQQAQSTQQNEQSMSLKVRTLAPGDARAVYKNTGYDLRRYKRLQMFTHAERLQDEDATHTGNGDLSVFIRLGTDYRNNYYEYSIPLRLTPFGTYSTNSENDRETVWPKENMFDFKLSALTDIKTKRNREKAAGNPAADFYRLFSEPDPENTGNTVSVMGNPTLSEVKTIMIGIRNNSTDIKSAEIWVNELRLTDYDEKGGWAANTTINMQLSDLGSVNMRGQMITAGFGALDESLTQRAIEDTRTLNFSTNLELGKFFPEKAQISIPFYYSVSDEKISPQYNPYDQDILLKDALDALPDKNSRDSLRRLSENRMTTHSLALNNIRVNVKSKHPMPYDPANFSFNYSYNKSERHNPDMEYNTNLNWSAGMVYDYSPLLKPIKPFAKIKKAGTYLKGFAINPLPAKITFQTNMIRSYSEEQVRNFSYGVGQAEKLPVTFMQNFVWDRAIAVNWNPLNSLRINFRSGTNARIEEPHVQVNKKLAPDEYKIWRDSVRRSIAELGTPIAYDQTFNVSYTLPTTQISALNWVNGSLTYNAVYNWDRGAKTSTEQIIGNTIRNQATLELPLQLNLTSLYRKSAFLKRIEQHITNPDKKDPVKKAAQPLTKKIRLLPDSTVTLTHTFASKKVRVSALGPDGKMYPLKTKIKDKNTIVILNNDSIEINVTVAPPRQSSSTPAFGAIGERMVYALMMLKSINLNYRQSSGLHLPGFLPNIKAAGGQGSVDGILAPGWDFAFGLTGEDFVDKAAQKGWLIGGQQNVSPSVYSESNSFEIKMTLEPIRELRINLTANRTDTRQTQTQYIYAGMPRTYGGNFVMTTIGLKGMFSSSSGATGYASEAFNEFLRNREIIAGRIMAQYHGATYPSSGFMEGSSLAGQPVSPENSAVSLNSADVLIPAFLSAYTQRSVGKIGLSAFPSLSSILPNWNVSYTGLSKTELLKKYFRNVRINHAYRGIYNVDSYSSYLGWVGLADGSNLGFIQDSSDPTMLTPVASMPFDIPFVRLEDSFAPLLGVEVTFMSGLGINTDYRKTRRLNLNLSAYQLVESNEDQITIGMNYKAENFAKLIGLQRTRPARKAKGGRNNNETATPRTGGALTVRVNYAYSRTLTLIRKIQDAYTQATNGNISHKINVSADYDISRMLTLRAYYDWDMNHPLVSSASFPITNSNFGVSFRFNLTQ
ncbi:gliding motility protein [Porphyromonas sp. COT-052 OH4946]|uniref:T9SS outer membrane translocon Sov/SprA n=1 Tax=Porphyromonas sp. COT-052 OH4946 TaxID=1515618 RepID=UPI00051DDDA2|nr:cell surface protein SprA [Porphyromonas sp. COT-052 OH4946]KGL54321.1 gliding motility protein [Porphyromonas sp. COT-052 OH4946]